MQRVISKVWSALSNPRVAVPYVRARAALALGLVGVSRYQLAALYLADLVLGSDRFRTRLESVDEDRYLELDVLDFRMRVDALDEGLSRELLSDGVREPLATAAYREELARLEAERGPLTVVDVGANIGYFALQYPALSRSDGRVVAIEPLPSNFALLEENVALNGFDDAVDCYRCAIGAETTRTTMHVSTHSNWGTVGDTMGMSHFVDEVEVPMWRLDDFLRDRSIPSESVDAIRMDVQGYEYEVFRGMTELLERGDVGLVFLEVHPWYLRETGEYDAFVSLLCDAGFEPVFAADGQTGQLRDDKASYAERELDLPDLDALRDVDVTTEIILRRE